jgi:hypothetical protein
MQQYRREYQSVNSIWKLPIMIMRKWGYRPRESRKRERQSEVEPDSRGAGSKKTEPPMMASHHVRFEGEPLRERKTVSADVHVDGTHTSRTGRDAGHTTSTPTSSGQNAK